MRELLPALILFALGIADWLTTRSILTRPNGVERFKLTRKGIERFGVTPFLLGRAAMMGVFGLVCSRVTGDPWAALATGLAAAVALFAAAVFVNNVIVLRRTRG